MPIDLSLLAPIADPGQNQQFLVVRAVGRAAQESE